MKLDVQCPKCGTAYQVDDCKIPENGVRARCPKCEHRFLVTRQEELELLEKKGSIWNKNVGDMVGPSNSSKKGIWTKERKTPLWVGVFFGGLILFIFLANTGIGWVTGDNIYKDLFKKTKVKTTTTAAVTNSPLDGGVRQVKSYLKENLKDPKSFKAIEWSPVAKRSDGGYQVRCKYRARNSFGGYVISNQVFVMDSNGNVIDVFNFGE